MKIFSQQPFLFNKDTLQKGKRAKKVKGKE